jgi:hypothetical protein
MIRNENKLNITITVFAPIAYEFYSGIFFYLQKLGLEQYVVV